MTDDPGCCGSGTCIIDSEGRCWCGQQWDGCATNQSVVETADPTDAERAVPNSNN